MGSAQQFSLRWNNYSQQIVTALDELRSEDELTDVTLSCEGQKVRAHKVLLSACSTYFRETFRENPCQHPVIILKGVSFADLQAVVTFMYNGQVNVTQDRLPTFLQTAELLQIKGLTEKMNDQEEMSLPIPKKRVVNANTDNRSNTPESALQRPPTPKRRKVLQNTSFQAQHNDSSNSKFAGNSYNSPGPSSSMSMNVSGSSGGATVSGSGLISHSLQQSDSNSAEDYPNPALLKFEEEEVLEEEEESFKNNLSEEGDNSMQDLGNVEQGAIGSYIGGASGGIMSQQGKGADGSGTDAASHVQRKRKKEQGRFRQSDVEDSYSQNSSSRPSSIYDPYNDNENTYEDGDNGLLQYDSNNGYDEPGMIIGDQDFENFEDNYDQDGNALLEGLEDNFNDDDSTETTEPTVINAKKNNSKTRPLPQLMKATPGLLLGQRLPMAIGYKNRLMPNLGGTAIIGTESVGISTPSFSLTHQLLSQKGGIPPAGIPIRKPPKFIEVSSIAAGGGENVGNLAEQVAPYICNICGKRYVHHRSLNDHKKSHTGATRCPICNKSFSKVANMRAHFSAQHMNVSKDDAPSSVSEDIDFGSKST